MNFIKRYIGTDLMHIVESYLYCPCGSKLEGIRCNRDHYRNRGYDKETRKQIKNQCRHDSYYSDSDSDEDCIICDAKFNTVLPGRMVCETCKTPKPNSHEWIPCTNCKRTRFVWQMDEKYLCKNIICVVCGYVHYKGHASCIKDWGDYTNFNYKCFVCHLWYEKDPTKQYQRTEEWVHPPMCPICTNKLRTLFNIKLHKFYE